MLLNRRQLLCLAALASSPLACRTRAENVLEVEFNVTGMT